MTSRKDLDSRPFPNPVRKNYDYGEGLYFGNMNKFKSVRDYLDRRKKRKNKKKIAAIVDAIEIFAQQVSKI